MNRYMKRVGVILACCLGGMAWGQEPPDVRDDARRHVPERSLPPEVVIELDLDDLAPIEPGESPYRPSSPAVPSEPASPARPPSPDMIQSPSCVAIERRLAYIQRELHAGHVDPRGNRLRTERRELEKHYRLTCH